ncbi:hypothetical protein ONZ45_g7906 [Pleurotus djamor]|nr:hypothetical protein ONZ45_g7906 [Pleurotus djamor]
MAPTTTQRQTQNSIHAANTNVTPLAAERKKKAAEANAKRDARMAQMKAGTSQTPLLGSAPPPSVPTSSSSSDLKAFRQLGSLTPRSPRSWPH